MDKYKKTVLLIFTILICVFSFFSSNAKNLPLLGKVIFIDPGHGGNDPGALYKNLRESDINLEISLILSELLIEKGAVVYMTRDSDYDLSVIKTNNIKRSDLYNRSKIINESNCDLYLSIHLNADLSSTWYGAQVFYSDVNKENKEIALSIQNVLRKHTNTKRDISKIIDRYLYKRIKHPGVLIELGFITNPNDRYLLQNKDYQIKINNLIVEGIIEYYNKK